MEYIGRRPGVILNSHMKHGLFGIVDDKKAEDIQSLRELSRYVEAKTQAGAITYRAVISLTEESLFWEKTQDIKKKAYVHYKISNAIRLKLINHVFREEMTALQSLKNEARQAAYNNMGGFFGGFMDTFVNMKAEEYAAAAEWLKREDDLADSRLIYSRFKTSDIKEIAADLMRLSEHVPSSGRLYYKLMPQEVKDEIDALIQKILDKNADCDREFKKYVYAAQELSKYYTDNPDTHAKAGKAAYDEMMKRLGNIVLRIVKDIKTFEKDNAMEADRKTVYCRGIAETLISVMFNLLARSANAEDRKVSYFVRTGELSKQAKKELALRKENSSGYEWE